MENIVNAIKSGKTALGIELGSTRIKASLIGENHEPIASGSFDWENSYDNGIWTYSIDEVWQGLQSAFASLKKNVNEKYEIFDMIEAITPNAKPLFGFKETTCPICGGKNNMTTFSMETLLFTQAQLEEYEASLRWAAKAQKRTLERKKLRSASKDINI